MVLRPRSHHLLAMQEVVVGLPAAAGTYISIHTVAHHLCEAFRKLHIASRVELARIVIEERR